MYLSSIDLFGFKSFAQRTRINFSPGVTAIVGPNGCGKSNLVDAIRWVLGEQRESALRSERMENVIFGGSPKRRPLGMAEISLTLHDTDGTLPLEYEEVTVTRRLFRSGKSEYLLNKSVCRLKDVVDLFMDTGIGPDSYSIIELKMVEEILSEDPNEMRHLLDEATGVTRYKIRRKEALRRLLDARQDKERALDISAEVEKQVNGLKRQVARLRAYKKLQEKATRIRSAIVVARVHQLEEQLGPLDASLREFQEQMQAASAELSSSEAEVMRVENELLQLEHERQNHARAFNSIQSSYQDILKAKASVEESIRLKKWQQEKNADETEKDSTELAGVLEQLEIARANLERSQTNLPPLERRLEEAQTAFQDADEAFRQARAQSIASREKLSTFRAKEAAAIRSSEERRASIKAMNTRLEDLHYRQREIQKDLDEKRHCLDQTEANLTERSEQLQNIRARRKEVGEASEEHREQVRSQQQEREQVRSKRDRIVMQIDHFEELHRRSLPLYSGGSALAVKFPGSVSAAIVDELQVAEKYTKAVESALQGTAFSRVLEREDSFETLVGYLSRENHGWAALMVGKPPPFSPETIRAFVKESGGEVLADLIQGTSRASNWIRYFLRNVAVFGTFEDLSRLALSAAQKSICLASLAGEFTDGCGFWILGSCSSDPPRTTGISERLKDLAGQLQEAEKQVQAIQDRISERSHKLAELESESDQLEKLLQEAQVAFDKEMGKKLQYEAQIASSNLLIEQLRRESSEIPIRIKELSFNEEAHQGELSATQERLEALESALQLQQKAETTALEERETCRLALAEVQLEAERSRAEVERTRDRVIALEERVKRLSDKLNALAAEKETLRTDEIQLGAALQERQERVADASVRVEEFRRQLDDMDSRRRDHQEIQRAGNVKLRELRAGVEEIGQRIHQVQLEKVQVETALKDERTKLEGVDVDAVSGESSNPEELLELERKIFSMEPLNLAAESEYAEQRKRLDFLNEQLRDLQDAARSLEQTITTLNAEATERFRTGFDRIQQNFKAIFKEIFEGGEADLRLGQDNPLEAYVEILATPGNKRIGSLSLLSGGEKALTAIALLFSIYIEKPSPFCILDEVDAPLDDENTLRFNRLLEKFTPKTQFLVVTHNKRTMEVARNLLGVTMEEEGISKVVPVQLD